MSEANESNVGYESSGGPAGGPPASGPAASGPGEPRAEAPRREFHPLQRQMFDPRRKSPLLAALLSAVPGVGQLYIGYYMRGMVIAGVVMMLLSMAANVRSGAEPALGLAMFFAWIFNVIDAGRMAALYNHAAAGTEVIEMPEDFKMPSLGGSIAGGAVLMTFGLIALSNTLLGFELDWLEDWWPVFPLALGIYLMARGVMDYQESRPAMKVPSATEEVSASLSE